MSDCVVCDCFYRDDEDYFVCRFDDCVRYGFSIKCLGDVCPLGE